MLSMHPHAGRRGDRGPGRRGRRAGPDPRQLLAELRDARLGRERSPRGSGCRARRSTTTCARSRRHGLVTVAEARRHGGLTERVLQATAASYIVAPIGDPMRATDRTVQRAT